MANERDPRSDLAAWLGEKLRTARLAAGYTSQDALARELGFDRTTINKIETGDRAPSDDVASKIAALFPDLCNGMYVDLARIARRSNGPIPGWFADWVAYEKTATVIKTWEPLLIPGLLQTPEYARALFRAWDTTGAQDTIDELTMARLTRQAMFDRANPPNFWAVVDETLLYRCIGEPKIMHDQLISLAELSERPRIAVHVVPAATGAHIGLLGAFAMASGGDEAPDIVYLESPVEGQTTKNPDTVAKIDLIFETLRSEALPRIASRDLIMKVAQERWNLRKASPGGSPATAAGTAVTAWRLPTTTRRCSSETPLPASTVT